MLSLAQAVQNLISITDFFLHLEEIWNIILASLQNSYGDLFAKKDEA